MHIIAADVGGTKTRLVFADSAEPRKVLHEARYLSGDFDSFEPMLRTFMQDCGAPCDGVNTLSLALPGLVSETSAHLTNLPWTIEKQKLKDSFGIDNIYFMNDFQASAFGTGQLRDKDRLIINPGALDSDGLHKSRTRVAVGAGTGLGVAWVDDGCHGDKAAAHTHATEGGHIDFAPTNDTQIELLKFLQQRFAHVSYERILSGDGLVSLYHFCNGKCSEEVSAEWINNQSDDEAADRALSLFVQIYGAYIGNIALLYKPNGGIFITGGIAAKMLKKMLSKEFMNAYLNKGRMQTLVEQIAVYLVINDRVGVLGAMSEAVKIQHNQMRQNSNQQNSKQQVS